MGANALGEDKAVVTVVGAVRRVRGEIGCEGVDCRTDTSPYGFRFLF